MIPERRPGTIRGTIPKARCCLLAEPDGRMPRYFFHIFTNGSVTRDEQGIRLNTLAKVELEAMRVLPDIARAEVPLDGNHQTFTVLVTDEVGHPVYTATLSFAGLRLQNSEPAPLIE
jgi:hypothetical protein